MSKTCLIKFAKMLPIRFIKQPRVCEKGQTFRIIVGL